MHFSSAVFSFTHPMYEMSSLRIVSKCFCFCTHSAHRETVNWQTCGNCFKKMIFIYHSKQTACVVWIWKWFRMIIWRMKKKGWTENCFSFFLWYWSRMGWMCVWNTLNQSVSGMLLLSLTSTFVRRCCWIYGEWLEYLRANEKRHWKT